MSTALMTGRIATTSSPFNATDFRAAGLRTSPARTKIVGVVCLLGVLTAAFIEIFARGRFNAAGALVAVLGMIAVTFLFCDNFSPLNRRLALLAASFNIVGLVVEALRLQPQGTNIAIVFDGFFCILIGCLAFGSTFAPRILGTLMGLGGLGWLTFLSPPLANYLSPYNLALGILGEGAVCLWLLFMGVNGQPGKQQASGAGDENESRRLQQFQVMDDEFVRRN
jgi:uncharacterized protein DUF4386